MADGGFDPCECVWSHEMAMRRLLSLLRQSQSYCTDNECFSELPGPRSSITESGGMENTMLLAVMWTFLAFVLFMMRPSSLRSSPDTKPANSNQDNGAPPSPPTAN